METGADERKLYGKLVVLESKGVVHRFPKKQTIIFQGDVPGGVHIIKSGLVKVYGITSDGDQRTVSLLNAGDVFPMSWVFDKTDVCMYYFEAASDSQILIVPKKAYQQALDTNMELRKQIHENYMSHYIAATMHVYALEHSHAKDKLIYILQYLTTRFGERMADGKTKINLRLSHQDIAEMVGITRETAAVELHKLKDMGYIEYQRFTYFVDIAKLQKLKGDEDIGELRI
ncbi:Crp/Fnr family transcriptional regulator [Candidatus Saccharibacteria bacterium]|nr:Crp/Fnr family transcriptional regulator [Candidatus Saccharibacteria bacterium]